MPAECAGTFMGCGVGVWLNVPDQGHDLDGFVAEMLLDDRQGYAGGDRAVRSMALQRRGRQADGADRLLRLRGPIFGR
jgi:hypothetical protein